MRSRLHPSAIVPVLLICLAAAAAPLGAQPAPWTQVSVGDDHVCALDARGRVYCLGNNHSGQLGARTPEHCGIVGESGHRSCYLTAQEPEPLRAGGEMRFTSVSAGRYVTCGVDDGGAAHCWGQPLGPPSAYRDRCLGVPCSPAPVPLRPEARFRGMDMEARCAWAHDGTSLCWGHEYRRAEEALAPWPDLAVVDVDADMDASTRCALAADGRVFCEGWAEFGFLGNGSRDEAREGTPVDHPVPFTQVAVAGGWACALDADGAAHCWGAAGYDDADEGATRPGFELCERWATYTWCNTRPVPVQGGLRFRSVTGMPRGSMPTVYEMVGITPDGEAYAWNADRTPRAWHPEHRWASVAAGHWGQCGVTTDGELFCWGRDPHEEVQGRIVHPGGA